MHDELANGDLAGLRRMKDKRDLHVEVAVAAIPALSDQPLDLVDVREGVAALDLWTDESGRIVGARGKLFEMEDAGDTIRVKRPIVN